MSLNQADLISAEIRTEDRPSTDWVALAIMLAKNRAVQIGAAMLVVLAMVFWPLFQRLPEQWFAPETYYNHGPLVPLMAGYMIYDRWPKIKQIPISACTAAIVPLALLLYANFVALTSPKLMFLSIAFVLTLSLGTLFVAGWKWAVALAAPTYFLILGLPAWETVADIYTQPMQHISTDAAFSILKGVGLDPLRVDDTNIWLNSFDLNVGAPCSGLRMIMAVIALVCFAIYIGKMKWWANLTLAAMAIPICILVNSIRIALIGVVGNSYGTTTAMKFHDTSGYISILLLVALLWQLTKSLGMK